MKKILACILILSMVFSFAACDNKSEEEESTVPEITFDFTGSDVGDYITFGKYEQDNDLSNGKEELEWLVIDKTEDKILVISKYVLDCIPYSDSATDITWELSPLRRWLNKDFIADAFAYEEEREILISPVTAQKSKYSKCDPGKTTKDRVFILDTTETIKYMDSYSARVCKATPYAIARGVYVASGEFEGNALWWTRSPGSKYQDYAANIGVDGEIFHYGYKVTEPDIGVRPVIWIKT